MINRSGQPGGGKVLGAVFALTLAAFSCTLSADHLERFGAIPVPRSTAHRRVVESNCDQITPPVEGLPTLLVDGTGFKRRPDPKEGKNNQGEVRNNSARQILLEGYFQMVSQPLESIDEKIHALVAEQKRAAKIAQLFGNHTPPNQNPRNPTEP